MYKKILVPTDGSEAAEKEVEKVDHGFILNIPYKRKHQDAYHNS